MEIVNESDQTLLESLDQLLPDSSKTTKRSMILERRISVDSFLVTDVRAKVSRGSRIRLWKKNKNLDLGVDVLYEDNDLLVIAKPAGLLSVEAGYEQEETTHQVLKNAYRPGRVFVVHRLDREVSGVMMFARQENVLWQLKEILKKREIEREYIAVVEGDIKEDSGVWKSYLFEDETYTVHSSLESDKGELAETHYQVLRREAGMSELLIRLKSGRKNQIRVQSSSFGHPIVGDKKYGSTRNPVGRVCLHSYKLSFVHPTLQKKMVFEQPLPEEFIKLWE